jgi:acyl-CoA thioesterase-1
MKARPKAARLRVQASTVLFLALSVFAPLSIHAQVAAASPAKIPRVVFLGDSLTEGYGVSKDKAFPALLGAKMLAAQLKWQVINAGVSGSTSASAKSRMDWQLKSKPEVIVIALGANDGLRGFKPEDTRKNLEEAIVKAKTAGVKVVLAGMQMPPNYGDQYREIFKDMYPALAKKHGVELIPFLLDKVAGEKEFNLEDGIHPNEKGYVIVAETVWKILKPILEKTPPRT